MYCKHAPAIVVQLGAEECPMLPVVVAGRIRIKQGEGRWKNNTYSRNAISNYELNLVQCAQTS